ncbi:cysteine desulfurase family protein [Erythrobacter sp. EC-HK427]|uniref:cysteine desulfurase family protein n=1 Tax=Erythrobacter sp. EC-HK427 TaxID=2038396 RepID=UPI001256C0EB|nr:aminotransferase class V-fold PLP-dependent enzyme [Erythrobacter sp. EC-HK427]VVT19677.1 Aminotransferase class V-fold PLP-dependent enzyme [Erythrobacter sp. EC-HK427]
MGRIYLDHAATSPLRPEAKAAMEEGFAIWANPSSPHAEGRKAKAALEDARERCKRALGWDGELIFTSGASESARLAYDAGKQASEYVSAVEHDCLINLARNYGDMTLSVGQDGSVQYAQLEAGNPLSIENTSDYYLQPALIAVQHVNSETGTLQDHQRLSQLIASRGGILLADCAQSAGKIALPPSDMAIVSAHKFGGPIGVGALLVRDFALLTPYGGHERGYRRGTENLPDIMGMAAALEAGDWATTAEQRAAFRARLGERILRIGEQVDYIIPLTHPTMSAQALLIRLDAMGFAVSAGSACSSGTLKKSRVLHAFGVDDATAARTIRVSLGWSTTPEELDAFVAAWESLH